MVRNPEILVDHPSDLWIDFNDVHCGIGYLAPTNRGKV